MDTQILHYRKMIDDLDFQMLRTLAQQKKEKKMIVALLKKRMLVVKRLAAYKKREDIPRFDLEREAYIFRTRRAYGKEIGLSDQEVKDFFCNVLKYSHKVIDAVFQEKRI